MQISVDDLALAAQRGSTDALHHLVDHFRPTIRGMAADRFLPGGDADDLHQEGMVGLWHAIRDFDPSQGPFTPFARLCIDRQMWAAVTKANRQRHRVLQEASAFEEWMDVPDDEQDPEVISINGEAARLLSSQIRAALSALESEVLSRYAQGESYDDIAVALAVHRKRIDNALQRARRKISAMGELARPIPA